MVEYCGKYKDIALPHGKSKSCEEKYVRTNPDILEKAYHLSEENKKAEEIIDVMGKDDSFQDTRNSKQIRNKKYRETVKKNPLKPTNVDDKIYQVLCSLQDSDFIQQIVFTNKKRPIVILYTEEQIQDLKSNCVGKCGSIIGIDKTFNLGSCFVSTLTYKNQHVIQRESKDIPIFLGPVMLQYESDFETFSSFFLTLSRRLEM